MFEKIMYALAEMNNLDKEWDYFITKRKDEYILCKMDWNGYVWDIGFSNDITLLKKIVWEKYGEIFYDESE